MKASKSRFGTRKPVGAGLALDGVPGAGNGTVHLSAGQLRQTVRAIRNGKVDALFVSGRQGEWMFTLSGADHAYRVLIEDMSEGALTLTADGIVTYANRRFAELLEVPLHQVIGSRIEAWFASDSHRALHALLADGLGTKRSVELDLLTAARRRVPVMLSSSPLILEGMPNAICMVATDLTGQKRSEAAIEARQSLLKALEEQQRTEEDLRQSLETLRLHDSALGAISQGVVITDPQHRITYVNRAFENMTGYTSAEVLGRASSILQGPDTNGETLRDKDEALRTSHAFHCELLCYRKDGSTFWNEQSITPVFDTDGVAAQFVRVLRDITQRKKGENEIRRLAHYDQLTGLPNRSLFRDQLAREIKRSTRTGLPIALFFIDLDGFKEVNDRLGHDAGDQLLQLAAQRISVSVRETDMVARIGGDEFTVILSGINTLVNVELIAREIIDELARPYLVCGKDIQISASVGITLFPQDANTAEDLIKNADQSMYEAKKAGRGQFNFFTSAMQEAAWARLKTLDALRFALPLRQLSVYYQPIVELVSGRILKAEALVRWHHPQNGLVFPDEFISLAEETGLIGGIDEWVLGEALADANAWRLMFGESIQISVNRSPIEFMSKEPMKVLDTHFASLGLAQISFEITEGILLCDSPCVMERLSNLTAAGVQLAIDDFGTGHSSMAYLKKFHVNYLKIDQSFVRDMTTNEDSRTIVETIIMMAHKLGLKVIAEGVETAEQRDWLREATCDFAQGYLFSQAVSAPEFEKLLRQDKLLHTLPA
ncbi:putative bifunctional diguanylate cyclase/phosphodiesterase [Massilia sp. TSP1-1-2]|uniref:putative bifunctional diguanylate cyclase/phosphodiesterase n=1 Tax=unclassified Massilia TaxID=2609279 RepID=UPI003CF0A39D